MLLDEHQLRSLVIACLQKDRQNEPLQISYLFTEVARLAKIRDLQYSGNINACLENRYGEPSLHPNLVPSIADIVWDLIVEGVLRPGIGRDNTNLDLPHIHVTPFGKEALAGNITAYDPDGYLKALSAMVPEADSVIITYIAESAETLRRNCLLSSTVTLGCASEQAFLLLLEAYREALNVTDQVTFDKASEKARTIKQKHVEFMKWYETKLKPSLKSAFGSDGITELETALTFVVGYFRTNRNDAGHPSEAKFSRNISSAHLVMFPSYLRVIYDVIAWLDTNKPL
jgi:hypothetical protein